MEGHEALLKDLLQYKKYKVLSIPFCLFAISPLISPSSGIGQERDDGRPLIAYALPCHQPPIVAKKAEGAFRMSR